LKLPLDNTHWMRALNQNSYLSLLWLSSVITFPFHTRLQAFSVLRSFSLCFLFLVIYICIFCDTHKRNACFLHASDLICLFVAHDSGELLCFRRLFSANNVCCISGVDGEFEKSNTPLQSEQHLSDDVPQKTVKYLLACALLNVGFVRHSCLTVFSYCMM